MTAVTSARAYPFGRRFLRLFVVGAASLSLAGCFGGALDELDSTRATGSAFSQALYENYSHLAQSFGDLPDVEDPDSWIPFFGTKENPLQPIQDAFANKALIAASGQEPAPEAAIDPASQSGRTRLVALIGQTRDRFPREAAAAQAQFDCWVLNSYVAEQAEAAQTCRRAFDNALLRLSNTLRPVAAPVAAPASAPVSDYTVLFGFDSWTLSAEALNTITDAVNTARLGGQSRIAIVGHSDTAGSAAYNQNLSERRANVVEEAMVQMGARREAITVTGVGETDLAVATGDGVREPRNRRAIVNLLP